MINKNKKVIQGNKIICMNIYKLTRLPILSMIYKKRKINTLFYLDLQNLFYSILSLFCILLPRKLPLIKINIFLQYKIIIN